MQYRSINNKISTSRFFTGGMFSLLMIMVLPVNADAGSSQFSVQQVAESSNPWALPAKPQNRNGYPHPYGYGQQFQSAPADEPGQQMQGGESGSEYRPPHQYQPSHQWQPHRDRFVTPSFLESLKKQQQQYQVMPENRQNQHNPWRSGSSLLWKDPYGDPLYGSAEVNPLYDTPAVSPWGDGPDVLYRGESFPLVPGEALGGFPPMHVPSFGMKNFKNSDPEDSDQVYENNVFNPFTFLPN